MCLKFRERGIGWPYKYSLTVCLKVLNCDIRDVSLDCAQPFQLKINKE